MNYLDKTGLERLWGKIKEECKKNTINALSGTSITLLEDTINSLTINEETTFILPEITDGKFHQILIFATVTSITSIVWGTNNFFDKTIPTIETGTYNFLFEYDGTNWCVGTLLKGSVS